MAGIAKSAIVGVLLAGGQSQRMGGIDKGLLPLGDRPMMAHVIDRLKPQVGSMIINTNGEAAHFTAFNLPVVGDTVTGYAGPLAGLLAGLRWAVQNAPDAAYVASVATDAPFLPLNLVESLAAAIADRPGTIAIARSSGGIHPVVGLWPVTIAGDLEAALDQGMRKAFAWTAERNAVTVAFPDDVRRGRTVDPFFNVNTPEDLEAARALLE